jgi:ligand-binding sensor domain-containing protein
VRYITPLLGILLSAALLTTAQGAPGAPDQRGTSGWVTHANADRANVLRAQANTLWAGTQGGGLVGWNVEDETFVQLLYPQDRLAGNEVQAIRIAPNGTLWVATTGGVSAYPPDGLAQDYTISNTSRRGPRKATVAASAATGERRVRISIDGGLGPETAFAPGYLMFGTDPTIYFYRGWNELSQTVVLHDGLRRAVEPGLPVYAVDIGLAADGTRDVVVDHQGRVWISTLNGVSVYDQGNWTVYTPLNSGLAELDSGPMAVDRNGRVWIGHPEAGRLTRYDDGEWSDYRIEGVIRSLTVDPDDGTVWAATNRLCDPSTCRGGGVWTFENGIWRQRYSTATQGIAADDVDSVTFGTEGRIWLGHRFALGDQVEVKVSRRSGSTWHIYDSVRQAIEEDYEAILTTRTASDLWTVPANRSRVWTRHRGAVQGYAPGSGWKELYTGDSIINSNQLTAVAADSAGGIWIGADRMFDGRNQVGGGINFWTGDNWIHYSQTNSGLPHNSVANITVGRGRVWVETVAGFTRFHNGEWTTFPDLELLVEADYEAIVDSRTLPSDNELRMWRVDDAERVWIWRGPGVEGVSYYTPETGWERYTFQSTLSRQDPPVAVLHDDAIPQPVQTITVPAVDIGTSSDAQAVFANGYLMLGDDPTVYRYESFVQNSGSDRTVLQISPKLSAPMPANTPVYTIELGLLSNVVSDVAPGPDGRIWVASGPGRAGSTNVYGGVSVLDVGAGTWEQYTVASTSHRGSVVGSVVSDVDRGLNPVPADFGSQAAADAALASGFAMFGDDPTLYRYVAYDTAEHTLNVRPFFNTVKYLAGVQQPLPAGTPIYSVELGLLGSPQGESSALELAVGDGDRMWIVVSGVGISVLDPLEEWTNYRPSNSGLSDEPIGGMMARGAEMWVWTDGGGLSIFRGGNWQTYNVFNSGLVADEVESLAFSVNSEVWLTTLDAGVSVVTLPGFRLDTNSNFALAQPGASSTVYFEVVPLGGFSGAVTLEIDGLPDSVTASFTPASITGKGWVGLRLDVSALAAPGRYPLTVIGRSGEGLRTTRYLTLRVVSTLDYFRLPFVRR